MKTMPDTLILPPCTMARSGAVAGLLKECRAFGRRGMLVHGRSAEANGLLRRVLAAAPADATVATWPHPGG